MMKHNILVKYDKDLRLRILYPEARKEITGDVVRFVRHAPSMNFVSFTFANEENLERVIDQELEYFAPMAQPPNVSFALFFVAFPAWWAAPFCWAQQGLSSRSRCMPTRR